MPHLRTAARLAITTGLLAGVMAWIALQLQLLPNGDTLERDARLHTTQSVAAALSSVVRGSVVGKGKNLVRLKETVETCFRLNDSIDQITVASRQGKKLLQTASKSNNAADSATQSSIDLARRTLASCDIHKNGRVWGTLNIYFRNSPTETTYGFFQKSWIALLFLSATVSLACWVLFSNAFRTLTPTDGIPQRVRSALDTLTEGVVLLKPNRVVAHSNGAFCHIINQGRGANPLSPKTLVGKKLEDFDWQLTDAETLPGFAWDQCLETKKAIVGQLVALKTRAGVSRFSVNASPILSNKGACRGALISFDNVTEIETQRDALEKTVQTVERQNEQLTFLASYDPMTKCFNRREFFNIFDKTWEQSTPEDLSLLMLDVDHFKGINDSHGHSFGDQVLIHVAEKIRDAVGDLGTVCRYGGEEFIVLIGDLELEQALAVGHKIREAIESSPVDDTVVTISVGFSNRQFKAMDQQHLLDQADQALYAAKRSGRNRVVRFDQCPAESELEAEARDVVIEKIKSEAEYSAVIGLLSSLSFRCHETANHSIRVANLAVEIGKSYLDRKDLYRLEVAALLHDVGKIGVPDSVLYKTDTLTKQEWQIMNRHDEIGLQIVQNTIDSAEIFQILKCRHYGFSRSSARKGQTVFGADIPVMSRILYVCDVFDTLVNGRVYRERMLIPEALAELLKCSPEQFDQDIVRCLVQHVKDHGAEVTQPEVSTSVDPRSAVAIGSHIEVVYQALEAGDLGALRETSRVLRTQASKVFAHELVDATIDLEEAVSEGYSEEDISRIAGELIGLCRETRHSLISVAGLVRRESEIKSCETATAR